MYYFFAPFACIFKTVRPPIIFSPICGRMLESVGVGMLEKRRSKGKWKMILQRQQPRDEAGSEIRSSAQRGHRRVGCSGGKTNPLLQVTPFFFKGGRPENSPKVFSCCFQMAARKKESHIFFWCSRRLRRRIFISFVRDRHPPYTLLTTPIAPAGSRSRVRILIGPTMGNGPSHEISPLIDPPMWAHWAF